MWFKIQDGACGEVAREAGKESRLNMWKGKEQIFMPVDLWITGAHLWIRHGQQAAHTLPTAEQAAGYPQAPPARRRELKFL